ncbi:MAG: site-specific integrase [Cyclobacteriaceae bacterium]|nr:site-specific integrase [Cyclobacteriaceae bacterium]
MAKVSCSIRKDWTDKQGLNGIFLTYIHQGERRRFYTEVSLNAEKYSLDTKTGLITPTDKISKEEKSQLEKNQRNLSKCLSKLQDITALLRLQNIEPAAKQIERLYLGEPSAKEEKERGVYDWYQEFIDTKSKTVNAGLKSYKSTLEHLKECFGENMKLEFSELTLGKLEQFRDYLTNKKTKSINKEGKEIIKKLKGPTIHKQFKNLRIFLNWIKWNDDDDKIKIPSAYRKISVKARYGDPIGLTYEQFIQLYQKDLSERKELERTRDIFVFGVSIGGPRHGDLQKIGKGLREDQRKLSTGKLTYFENKTGKAHLDIAPNKIGVEILKKYNYCFPHVPSNYRMNVNLKTIAALLKWDEPKEIPSYNSSGSLLDVKKVPLKEIFSTKFMRKTAISIDAKLGIAPQVSMKRSGHSTWNSYKRYLDVDKKILEDANTKWDEIYSDSLVRS